MKRLFFLCCMIVSSLALAKKWDAAYIAKLIASGGIDKVIEYYQQKYYSPDRDPQDAFKIAELYGKKKDYATAMQWYDREKQLINTSKVNLFNYANTCRLMGEYQKALDGYLMYAAQTGDVNKVMDLANQCERVLKASAQADNFKLENYTYNTAADETNLSVIRTNPIYITVTATGEKDEFSYIPHQVVRDYQNFAEPADVLSPSMAKTNITGLTYTRDGNTVAYSSKEDAASSKSKTNKKHDKIFIADNLGGNFLNVKPFPFNSDLYSVRRPAFNSDGTVIYFSSDMPGGLGGFDIWKCTLEHGSWTRPLNLGKLLNSNADELNPFVVQDLKDDVLYFSSDREGGFGGFDIYAAKNIDQVWQDVEMQPAPINSAGDDISVIYDNDINTGYVSSDRNGGNGGFDVYRFIPFNLRLVFHALDSASNSVIDYALVELSDNNIKVNEGVTNENGRAVFQVGKDKTYRVTVSKDNYKPYSFSVNSIGKISGDSVVTEIVLKKDPKFSISNGATNNLSMENYITFTGQVMDASTGKPAKFAKMRMVNYATKKLRELDLDEDGRFQIKLLLNNSYKVILENQDYKISDELTTYGLDKYDVKVRDYLLSGNKFKLLDNKVYPENNVPPGLKVDMKHFDPATAYATATVKKDVGTVVNTPVPAVKAKKPAAKVVAPAKKAATAVTPAPAVNAPSTIAPKIVQKDTVTKTLLARKDTVLRKPVVLPKPQTETKPVEVVKQDTIVKIIAPKKDTLLKNEMASVMPVKKAIAKENPIAIPEQKTIATTGEIKNTNTDPEKPKGEITQPGKKDKPVKSTETKTVAIDPSPAKDTVTLEEAIAIWREKVKKEGITEPKGAGIFTSKIDKPSKQSRRNKEQTPAPVVPVPSTQQVVQHPMETKTIASPVQQPAEKDTTTRPDIYYKIQLGSYKQDSITFPELYPLGKVETVQSYGQYIYRLGDFYTLDDAKAVLDKVRMQGYYVAFVLQYNRNKVTGIVK